jgi:hypothetical protein
MFGGGSQTGLAAIRSLARTSLRSLRSVMRGVTDDEAAWLPPGTANAIGPTCLHAIHSVDSNVQRVCLGQPTVYAADGWAARFGLEGPPAINRATMLAGGVAALDAYHRAVAAALDEFLDSLAEADLPRVVETWRGPVTVADLLTLFIAFHTAQHVGEISVVKGLQGKQGFLF